MPSTDSTQVRFPHGRVLITTGVIDLVLTHQLNVLHYFRRHMHGDWGDIPLAHRLMNEAALPTQSQLFSAYSVTPAWVILVITELSRGITTMLLPEELESYHTDIAN